MEDVFSDAIEPRARETLQDNVNDTPEQKQRKALGRKYNELYEDNSFENVDWMITDVNIMNKHLSVLSTVLHALSLIVSLQTIPELTPDVVQQLFQREYRVLQGKETVNEKSFVNFKIQFIQNLKYMIYRLVDKGVFKTQYQSPFMPVKIEKV